MFISRGSPFTGAAGVPPSSPSPAGAVAAAAFGSGEAAAFAACWLGAPSSDEEEAGRKVAALPSTAAAVELSASFRRLKMFGIEMPSLDSDGDAYRRDKADDNDAENSLEERNLGADKCAPAALALCGGCRGT